MTESDAPDGAAAAAAAPDPPAPYRVLARKYRPQTFGSLIGQDALVRTLRNAFRSGRMAHAYMLAGVRGIGKTTTARIIARALNCVGADGTGGPTADPCGVCVHCRAIAEDRHVDVLEMDAASRTGVDDIREVIEGVRYRPTSARYKVYIVDEVHMLSKHAFNALLKTLEEPPEHVRFVFATTEIRKVPVTVLSRCQRFDLRRVDQGTLAAHFRELVGREGAQVTDGALQMIARAADGSVRDGLSLLDQAIAHAEGTVDDETVRRMLGLADRIVVFDLFEAAMAGDMRTVLDLMAGQYAAGADPAVVLEDLLSLTHWLTRIRLVAQAADDPGVPEAERVRGRNLAEKLPMPELTRSWQILLKGLGETRAAPEPLQAAEMALIRLAFAARLPTPAEALAKLGPDRPQNSAPRHAATHPDAGATSGLGGGAPAVHRGSADPRTGPTDRGTHAEAMRHPVVSNSATAATSTTSPARSSEAAPAAALPMPGTADNCELASFQDVVALAGRHREGVLQGALINAVHLVRFEPGRIELRLSEHAPQDLPHRLSRFLSEQTGSRWLVTVSRADGEGTLAEQRAAADARRIAAAAADPLVRDVLAAFPGARIRAVRSLDGPAIDAGRGEPGRNDPGPDDLGPDDPGPDESIGEQSGLEDP
ncbi:MAG: DNA polymerase III subunit gamma/tau [Rhodospirillales bacterium]|nr:MAG: DNA polymerase III subunit gamma/tau [Rhodospirillales bacterium]